MEKILYLILLFLALFFFSCANEKKVEANNPKAIINIDSVSEAYVEKAMSTWPQLYKEKIPKAITLLDSAILIDERNVYAYTNKLMLLQISDSVKGRNYFFEIEELHPSLPLDPFVIGLMNEFYNKPIEAKQYYFEYLEIIEKIKADTLNNTEEIHLLDAFGHAYLAINDSHKADSIFKIIDNEFPFRYREKSLFFEEKFRNRETLISSYFDGFRTINDLEN